MLHIKKTSEKFPSLVLSRNTIMLQHVIIQFSFNDLSTGRLRKLKAKEKFKFLSPKVIAVAYGREVVGYKRFQI